MFLSIFDIFKPGIGPSSSHTMGPMVAAARFLSALRGGAEPEPGAGQPAHLTATLHGSLAWTGKGHATDRAVMLGLLGFEPATVDMDAAETALAELRSTGEVMPADLPAMRFDPEADVIFDWGPPLPGHANGIVLRAFDVAGNLRMEETYYSVGGGFVVTERELSDPPDLHAAKAEAGYPHPFGSAAEMLAMAARSGLTIAQMKWQNECTITPERDLGARVDAIWTAMNGCIDRGLRQDGILPGGLSVKRRAKAIHAQLQDEAGKNLAHPHVVNDWLSVYAMAVNEENAAGGKVVTSPTNGAEGEVGSASAMAAAGLCAALGGTSMQIENAAEIALEHHLGMTCDPAGGLVQVPCIERNGLGAIKAVSAASLSLRGDGTHFMPLDNCIEAMRQTGRDMSEKYKETSQGGLAVNLPEC